MFINETEKERKEIFLKITKQKLEAGGQEPRPPGEALLQDEEGAAKVLGGRTDWRESAVLLPSPCV